MLNCGHNGVIAMEATFETNVSNYLLFLLLMFDDWKNIIFLAYVLTSRMTEEYLVMGLQPLRKHLQRNKEEFFSSFFIVSK